MGPVLGWRRCPDGVYPDRSLPPMPPETQRRRISSNCLHRRHRSVAAAVVNGSILDDIAPVTGAINRWRLTNVRFLTLTNNGKAAKRQHRHDLRQWRGNRRRFVTDAIWTFNTPELSEVSANLQRDRRRRKYHGAKPSRSSLPWISRRRQQSATVDDDGTRVTDLPIPTPTVEISPCRCIPSSARCCRCGTGEFVVTLSPAQPMAGTLTAIATRSRGE